MDTATNSSGNCSMPFDSRGFTNVAILRAISGLVSAFCAFYSVLLIVAFKRYLLSFQRIALYFCISSLIKGLSDATNRVDYVFRNAAIRATTASGLGSTCSTPFGRNSCPYCVSSPAP